MRSECANGHTENLSWSELARRLANNDFECREDGCDRPLTYEIDERFWEHFNGEVSRRPSKGLTEQEMEQVSGDVNEELGFPRDSGKPT